MILRWSFGLFGICSVLFFSAIWTIHAQTSGPQTGLRSPKKPIEHPQPVALIIRQQGKTLRESQNANLVITPPNLTPFVTGFLENNLTAQKPEYLYGQNQFHTYEGGYAELLMQGGMIIKMGANSSLKIAGAAYRKTDGMVGWRILFGPGNYILVGITRKNEKEVRESPLNGGFACVAADRRKKLKSLPQNDYPLTIKQKSDAVMVECRAKITADYLLPHPTAKTKSSEGAADKKGRDLTINSQPKAFDKVRKTPITTSRTQLKSVNKKVKSLKVKQPPYQGQLSRKKIQIKVGYIVQIGAFRQKKYAIERFEKVKETYQNKVQLKAISGWYKVILGPFPHKGEATKIGQKIQKKHNFPYFIQSLKRT